MAIPAAPRAGQSQPQARRTRKTDAWTTLFFALTGTLGAWSLVLTGLVLLRIVDPSYDADEDTFRPKAVGAATVALIAVAQAFTMGAAMGKLPKVGLRMASLMRTHRRVGRLGLVLAGAVSFLCWRSGGGTPTPEGVVHGFLASTGFVAIALKLALFKWRPQLAFAAAPWLGLYAAVAFILVFVGTVVVDDLFELDDDTFGGADGGDDGSPGGEGE